MSMHDPVADMLTRIRNGQQAKHQQVKLISSNLKEEIRAGMNFKIFRNNLLKRILKSKILNHIFRTGLKCREQQRTPILTSIFKRDYNQNSQLSSQVDQNVKNEEEIKEKSSTSSGVDLTKIFRDESGHEIEDICEHLVRLISIFN